MLEAVIGRGGTGTVYRAEHRGPEGFTKKVAIKLLRQDQSTLDLLRDEARLLALTSHPVLIRAEPPICVDDRWAVVMEFVEGVPTSRLLRNLGPLPPSAVLQVGEQVASCLHSLYHQPTDQGVLKFVHRDITPSNIMVTPTGAIRLLDLGLATSSLIERADPKDLGRVVGNKHYMPPERLKDVEGPKSDVFSLGCTLRRLATGDKPLGFGHWDPVTRLEPPHPMVDTILELTHQCQQTSPQARPSMLEVATTCRKLLEQCDNPDIDTWSAQATQTIGRKEEPVNAMVLRCVQGDQYIMRRR